MKEQHVEFFSEGYKLNATLYLPDDYKEGEKRPAIIPNSGYQGFNEFYPRLFSRYLTEAGFVCFGFDYRGFTPSEGPKGRVILEEQIEDIKNAVTFLQTQKQVDPSRIGTIGWGMGASNVIREAALDYRVQAVAALNGFYVGERWLKIVHSYVEWKQIQETIQADRVRRVTTGVPEYAGTFAHYPLDPDTSNVVNDELVKIPGFGESTSLELTESIIEMNAEKVVKDLAPRPLLIAHGKDNLLHPVEEAKSLFATAEEPKELVLIDGKHNDFMYYDHAQMNELMKKLTAFFSANL